MKRISFLLSIFLPMLVFAIDVKIENPHLDLDAKNNLGNAVISAHCKLTVSGIKGKDFDLVAIVKDDKGEWHKNSSGNTVKTYYKCNATYQSTEWKDIQVYLKHSVLAPKPGKHTYEVFLYVYYNDNWYGGVRAGSYNLTGSSNANSNNSSKSSSRSNTTRSNSNSSTTTVTCAVCKGSGLTNCLMCAGLGGRSQFRCLPYPPYTSYTEWVTCTGCRGNKKVTCIGCKGAGVITYNKHQHNNQGNYNYNNNSNYNSNYYNSNSSSSSRGASSAYTTCRICGGSGVCTSCHGSGGEWRDTGYYTGENVKSWIDCPSCHGNKRCFNCHGTGRQ